MRYLNFDDATNNSIQSNSKKCGSNYELKLKLIFKFVFDFQTLTAQYKSTVLAETAVAFGH